MIDFIPLEYYTLIYYLIAMLVVFSTYFFTTTTPILSVSTTKYNQFIFLFFIFTLFYMGLRPISGKYFLDMRTYANIFEAYQNYAVINTGKDIYFHRFMSSLAKIISLEVFFLLCAFLYIYPLYLISKKWFQDYWFYAFLMLVTAFSFWAYGTNGIRNGIAGSLFLLGISRDKKISEYLKELINIHNVKENVVFLGRKSNPYKYLNRAKVLALSSYYEGTPNVIVEALATGTPIVSSNCTEGIKELMSIGEIKNLEELMITESGIITPNFFKGFLEIDKNEAITVEDKFFAKALQMVLNDNSIKENLIKNRNKLLKKFDLQNVAIKYLS